MVIDFQKKREVEKGITLASLVITVIILIILSAVGIGIITGNDGIFRIAEESAFKQRMLEHKENLNIYFVGLDSTQWDAEINVGPTLLTLVQQYSDRFDILPENVDGSINSLDNMIGGLSRNEADYLVIYHSQLYYVSMNSITNNSYQAQWARELRIPVLDFTTNE